VKEFVYAKMEDELRLSELAQSVGLSTAHFSEMSLLALIVQAGFNEIRR